MVDPNAAAVVLFEPYNDRILVVHEYDAIQQRACFGIPGGKREPSDTGPAATATRELMEETGVELQDAELLLVDTAGPHVCACFLAVAATVPPSLPGNVSWIEAHRLVEPDARFPDFYAKVFVALTLHSRAVFRRQSGMRRLQQPSLGDKRHFFPQF